MLAPNKVREPIVACCLLACLWASAAFGQDVTTPTAPSDEEAPASESLFAPSSIPGADQMEAQPDLTDDVGEAEEPAEGAIISPRIATLSALDKVTARVTELTVGLDQTASFEALEITLRTCNKRPPEEPPETTAFLEIVENRPDGEQINVFTGWMFASSPALNALEHSVYDVWVIDCKISEPESSDESL